MGGGLQCLTWNITNKPNDPIDTWSCKRGDGRDLIRTWKEDKEKRNATHKFLRNTKDLKDLDYAKTDYVLGKIKLSGNRKALKIGKSKIIFFFFSQGFLRMVFCPSKI